MFNLYIIFLRHLNVLAKFQGKPSILHTLLTQLKMRDSFTKKMFLLLKILCQLTKPSANEITEPLAFNKQSSTLR